MTHIRLIGSIFAYIAAITLFLSHGQALAQSPTNSAACKGCNIVEEGLWDTELVGKYVYEKTSDGFIRVKVTAIRRDGPFRAIQWKFEDSGESGWNDATGYYSEQSVAAITEARKKGQDISGLSDSEKQNRRGLIVACSACSKARENDEVIAASLMCNACCNSQAAKKFGTPPGICP
jgi:hypothetical protein